MGCMMYCSHAFAFPPTYASHCVLIVCLHGVPFSLLSPVEEIDLSFQTATTFLFHFHTGSLTAYVFVYVSVALSPSEICFSLCQVVIV